MARRQSPPPDSEMETSTPTKQRAPINVDEGGKNIPTMQVVADDYVFRWDDHGIEIRLDQMEDGRDGDLRCEITVFSYIAGKTGLLHNATFNVLAQRTRSELINKMTDAVSSLPWREMIEAMCFKAKFHFRNGSPPTDLRTVDTQKQMPMLMYPWIGAEGGTVLFGDGSAGKTTLAITLAACVATDHPVRDVFGRITIPPSPVLICDWEASEISHAERLQAVCRGLGIDDLPQVFHMRMVGSLWEQKRNVAKYARDLGVKLVIYDSMAAACDGEIESSRDTNRFYNATNMVGLPWIGVTHINQESAKQAMEGGAKYVRPFGSAFVHNRARGTWYIERISERGSSKAVLYLVHYKNNNGPLQKDRAFQVEYDTTTDLQMYRVRYTEMPPTAIPELALRLPLDERIMARLNGGGTSAKDIADDCNVKEPKVAERLTVLKHQGKVVSRGGIWHLNLNGAPDHFEDAAEENQEFEQEPLDLEEEII
jgi:hypothetical protein